MSAKTLPYPYQCLKKVNLCPCSGVEVLRDYLACLAVVRPSESLPTPTPSIENVIAVVCSTCVPVPWFQLTPDLDPD